MRNLHRSLSLSFAVSTVLCAASFHARAADETGLEEIVVFGRGEVRQVQTIDAMQIAQLPAGTSPLKAIEKMPGVNFQSADAYGAYEWSTRITVRGFNQNRMGFTLDDVPLGDMTYGNHNGLHISRAIPSELVAGATLAQGSGSLDTASTSNLGGTVAFASKAPAAEFGVDLEQMFGSDSARRTFVKVDSGEFGPGTRGYLAFTDSSNEKWRGAGDQNLRMYTLKATQPVGEGTLTAYYNNSDRMETDYQDLSKDIVARRGWDWDNWYPDWSAAVAAAQACNASGQNDAIACDDAYWNASGLRKDRLGYLALALPLSESLDWNTTVYVHKNDGQGLWGTPYTTTPGGAPLSVRTTEYDLDRQGVLTSLTYTAGSHEINGGLWYEDNDFMQARRFYGEYSVAAPTQDYEEFMRNPLLTQWAYDFKTTTLTFHLQDTWGVSDTLRLNYGFRSVDSENEVATIVGDAKNGTIEVQEHFLPQVGLTWDARDALQIFGSIARNVRAFASSGTSGPFSTTAAGFAAIRDVLKPEMSTNYEAGVRLRGDRYEALLAVYHVDFEDRLVGISSGPGIIGSPSILANVGSVRTNGIETALTWRPLTHVSWFTSLSWNDSEFADDYATTSSAGVTTIVPVSGKQVPDSPEFLVKSELSYDNDAFFARADANFTDERYYTYLNEGSVDAYVLLNLGVGYRFTGLGVVQQLTIQADVTNVTDERYYSTIDSNGFFNSDPNGTAQTLLPGAPRQFFVGLKAQF